MKQTNIIRIQRGTTIALLTAGVFLSGLVAPGQVVLRPNSTPYGKSYGEWLAAHWQWLLSIQVSQHPLFQDGNVDLTLNQPPGPVWFLGGTFTVTPVPGSSDVIGKANRTGTIPAGKALFFPILDTEWDNAQPPPNPPTTFTTDQLRQFAAAQMNSAINLACEIDGVSVQNLSNPTTSPYRVTTPVFNYWLPATDNVDQFFGLDITGVVSGAVADGICIMLAPLPVGQHRIHFTGTIPGSGGAGAFILDITYNITVAPHRTD
jgi:hypothetical protein